MFTLEGGAISWRSIKQSYVVDSTMKVEYVAPYEATKEAVWLRNFLLDPEEVPLVQSLITLYCDNSEVVATSKEPRTHKRTKHVEHNYHLLRDSVHRNDVVVTKIISTNNLAGPFLNSLQARTFDSHLEGVRHRCITV